MQKEPDQSWQPEEWAFAINFNDLMYFRIYNWDIVSIAISMYCH